MLLKWDREINLVVLDKHPVRCAQAYTDNDLHALTDGYINTLALAHTQRTGGAMPKHVLAKWAIGQLQFVWLAWLIAAMLDEQFERFDSYDLGVFQELGLIVEDAELEDPRELMLMVPRFLQLLPHKIPGNPVEAYRQWYQQNSESPSWTYRGAPDWWKGPVQDTLQF